MILNNNFRGKVNGKDIYECVKEIDYLLESVDERIEKVNQALGLHYENGFPVYDEIWETMFEPKGDIVLSENGKFYIDYESEPMNYVDFINWCDVNGFDPIDYLLEYDFLHKSSWKYSNETMAIKINLNNSDALYSESNVANILEILGSYILRGSKKKDDKNWIKTYNTKSCKDRISQEVELINSIRHLEEDEDIRLLKLNKRNSYKKVKSNRILKEDCEKYPVVDIYNESYKALLKKYKSMQIKDDLTKAQSREKHMLKNILAGVRKDALDAKECFERPIKWKTPLKDAGCPDWEYLDLAEPSHIKALLQIPITEDIESDLNCIRKDLESLVDRTPLTDKQRYIINLWKKDLPTSNNKSKSVKGISKILGMQHQNVSATLNRAVQKVANKYLEELEDWYYLNIRKGEYVECSKCHNVCLKIHAKEKAKGYVCKDC